MPPLSLLLVFLFSLLTSATPLAPRATPPMTAEAHRRRGVPYNDASFPRLFVTTGAQVGWCYNWDFTTVDSHTPYLEYVPMLWGNDPQHNRGWWDAVVHAANVKTDEATHLLGFNEPDNCV
jgi:hypothetical protein